VCYSNDDQFFSRQQGAAFLRIHLLLSADFAVEGFTKKTFTAMIEGVREAALKAGIIEPQAFERGIRDLYRTAEADGVFCYTFFKAVAVK